MRWLWKEEKEDGLKKSDREMRSFLFHRIEIEGNIWAKATWLPNVLISTGFAYSW